MRLSEFLKLAVVSLAILLIACTYLIIEAVEVSSFHVSGATVLLFAVAIGLLLLLAGSKIDREE